MATDDPGRATDPRGEPRREGFFASDNVWILIPLAALSIPILAVTGDSPLVWVIGALAVIAAITASTRSLLGDRHDLRLREMAVQERLAVAERERLAAVDRVLEHEGVPLPRLDDLHRAPEPARARQPPPRVEPARAPEPARSDAGSARPPDPGAPR
jgi:hypothetical protein